jgi:hypothetical protein
MRLTHFHLNGRKGKSLMLVVENKKINGDESRRVARRGPNAMALVHEFAGGCRSAGFLILTASSGDGRITGFPDDRRYRLPIQP